MKWIIENEAAKEIQTLLDQGVSLEEAVRRVRREEEGFRVFLEEKKVYLSVWQYGGRCARLLGEE